MPPSGGPGFTPRKMYLTKISRPRAASGHHHLAKHLPAGKRGHFEARNFGHTEERARATLVKERLAAAGRVPLIIAER